MIDFLKISRIISDHPDSAEMHFNQQHRSYDKKAVMEILEYQKKNRLNNTQVAEHFKMSRNTIAKWKQIFGK